MMNILTQLYFYRLYGHKSYKLRRCQKSFSFASVCQKAQTALLLATVHMCMMDTRHILRSLKTTIHVDKMQLIP